MSNLRNNALSTTSLFTSTLLNKDTYYRVQKVNLPGLSISNIETAMNMGIALNFPGTTVQYQLLTLTLIIDTQLNAWKEIVRYFQRLSTVNEGYNEDLTHMSLLQIYDSKNNYLFKIEFYGCLLHTLSDLDYDTTGNNEEFTIQIQIHYDYYKIVD